jgi:hypothetical protein
MTVTIATPDRKTVTAFGRARVDPTRLTACLRRTSWWFAGVRVHAARAVAVPLAADAHAYSVLGELELPWPTTWNRLMHVAQALALELQAAGFAIE